MPTISIVILNWNGRTHLATFLPSVMSALPVDPSIVAEVVVADNASTDDSVDFVRRVYPAIRIIEMDRNHGFAGGYNIALKQVRADYYVLLNSDVEVPKGWIEPVLKLMESNPAIGACQPKILMYKDRTTFEYAGAAGGWMDSLGYPFAKGRVFDVCEQDHGQYDEAGPVFWAGGCAMFVRASLYHRLGGLDSYFFAHQEEIDLCWRIQLAGAEVWSCPQSVVYHLGGGTLPKGNERKVFLNFRNNLIMITKNLPYSQLWWKLPFRMILDGISAFKYLADRQPSYFRAVFRAHIHFYKWLLFNRRQSVFPAKRGPGRQGWYIGSVAWEYFIHHKKTFGQIVSRKT